MAVKFSGGFKPPQGLKVANIEGSPWKALGTGVWAGSTTLSHPMFDGNYRRIFPLSNGAVLGYNSDDIYLMQSDGSVIGHDVQFAGGTFPLGVSDDETRVWVYNTGASATELTLDITGSLSQNAHFSWSGYPYFNTLGGGRRLRGWGFGSANDKWLIGTDDPGAFGDIRGRRFYSGNSSANQEFRDSTKIAPANDGNPYVRYNSYDGGYYIGDYGSDPDISIYYSPLNTKTTPDAQILRNNSDGNTWYNFSGPFCVHNDYVYAVAQVNVSGWGTGYAIQVFKINGSGPYTYDWQENIFLNDPELGVSVRKPLGMEISPDGSRIMMIMGRNGKSPMIIPISRYDGVWKVDEVIETGGVNVQLGYGQYALGWVDNSTCLITSPSTPYIMQLKETS